MATLRNKNKTHQKFRSSRSTTSFSAFDQFQIQELKEAFNLIDQDKDGIISHEDLNILFLSLGKADNTNLVKEMLNECTGPLNFTMFLSLFAEKFCSNDQEQVLLNAFSILDPDQTGKISVKMFRELITTVGDRFSKEEVEELLLNVPESIKNEVIDYHEFAKLLKNGDQNSEI